MSQASTAMENIADDLHADVTSLSRSNLAAVASVLLSMSTGGPDSLESQQILRLGERLSQLEAKVLALDNDVEYLQGQQVVEDVFFTNTQPLAIQRSWGYHDDKCLYDVYLQDGQTIDITASWSSSSSTDDTYLHIRKDGDRAAFGWANQQGKN